MIQKIVNKAKCYWKHGKHRGAKSLNLTTLKQKERLKELRLKTEAAIERARKKR